MSKDRKGFEALTDASNPDLENIRSAFRGEGEWKRQVPERARQPAAIGKEAAWIRMDHLRQAQQAPFLCRVEPSYRPGLDLVPIFLAAPLANEASKPAPSVEQDECANLDVWYGPMPESNGKTNWTAILHKGDLAEGHTIDRSEYPDRVRYAADCVRYLIGELKERPWILDYDADKHSGYVANVAQGAEAVAVAYIDPNDLELLREYGAVSAELHATPGNVNTKALYFAAPPAQTALMVTPAMVKAAIPWLTGLHHMRNTDAKAHIEEAIKAALTAAQSAGDTK